MREIKFRGKRIDNNEWIYGFYMKELGGHYILVPLGQKIEVIPESVGQYTGLKDKNNVEIYEGDIIYYEGLENYEVIFDDGSFMLKTETSPMFFANILCEIIGNKFENPIEQGE